MKATSLSQILRVAVGLMCLAFALVLTGCKEGGSPTGQKYHCPMHPTYVADRAGDCPICGMKLVPIKADKTPPATNHVAEAVPGANAKLGQFYCPMDSEVISNASGRCPTCRMKLVEKTNETANVAATAEAEHAHASASPGRAVVTVEPDKQQLIGLRTSKVEKRELGVSIRTTATFEHDETRLARIAPRFSGWIRDLKVNFTGQHVEKGDPLLTVYSPDLLSAENEYLLAYARLKQLQSAPGPERDAAQRLADSSRRRLSLWEISDEEIREIEQSGKATDEVLLRAPSAGHVTVKNAVAGKAFMAGETLYEIADLSHLWLRAYVYEYELPLIKIGQKAQVTLPYLGNKSYEGKVSFIYPHIEQQTRRAELRIEFDNPNHELRPAMWADVQIRATHGTVLAVPASAVIDSGTRYVAFVKHGTTMEPREVKIGTRTDDYWEVLSGLKENEEVVTRALFLVDSESQLKAAIDGMGGHE